MKFGKDFYYEFTINSSKFKNPSMKSIKSRLDGLEKRGDCITTKVKKVVTIGDFTKNPQHIMKVKARRMLLKRIISII